MNPHASLDELPNPVPKTFEKVSRDTINFLNVALKNIKQNKDLCVEPGVWDDEAFRESRQRRDMAHYSSLERRIEKADKVWRFLIQLGTTVGEYGVRLETERSSLKVKLGELILRLPDEVLQTICLFSIRLSGAHKAPVNLSHVSQRFRSVMLKCPRAWAVVSSDMTVPWFNVVFERNQYTELQVEVNGKTRFQDETEMEKLERLETFIRIAVSRTQQVQVLSVQNAFTEPLNSLMMNFASLSFPRLELIIVKYDDSVVSPILLDAETLALDELVDSWNPPKLRELSLLNCIPSINLETSVSELTVSFHCFKMEDGVEIDALFAFIWRTRTLMKLHLLFDCEVPLNLPSVYHAENDSIETLMITLRVSKDDITDENCAPASIVSSLTLPNVIVLFVKVNFKHATTCGVARNAVLSSNPSQGRDVRLNPDKILKELIPPSENCPNITTLDLRVTKSKNALVLSHFDLGSVLELLPKLHHLTVHSHLAFKPMNTSSIPFFRSVTFSGCELSEAWIRDFRTWLNKRPGNKRSEKRVVCEVKGYYELILKGDWD